MGTWLTPALITGTSILLIQAIAFFRWLHRKMRDDEVHRVFLRDVATNHLPHVYSALRDLARAQGVELSDPPPVQFIQFDANGKSK